MLFVNVSIGGMLTTCAAPPVLMVAATWGWDSPFMFAHFGWKAILAVSINALIITVAFHREIVAKVKSDHNSDEQNRLPGFVIAFHLLFLLGVVVSPTIHWLSWLCCCSWASPWPICNYRIA